MKKKAAVVINKLKTKRKWKRKSSVLVLLVTVLIAIFAYFTNPFVRFSLIADPFHSVEDQDGQIVLNEDTAIFVKKDPYIVFLAYMKAGWHIVDGRFIGGAKAKDGSVKQIISEIHKLRFNPDQPFLISGDHFSVLYPRSLGIFYHSALDWRTALDAEDWKNRQLIYLKTIAYALQVFEESDRLSTTVVPVAPRSVVLMNVYAQPSDTLYSLLYALRVLQDHKTIERLYPYQSKADVSAFPIQTQLEANTLLEQHKSSLQNYVKEYSEDVYDPQIGLIRPDIYLSGAKDMAKRQSAFYDNVVYWRTLQLANELKIVEAQPGALDELKKRILVAFWDEETGIFIEDLSEYSKKNHTYSSDWLIAQMTGFLDPSNPEELKYLTRSVEYIQKNEIDQPFGLRYSDDASRAKLVGLPRLFSPSYGTTAIWSHWGQEYIKLLVRLGEVTADKKYFEDAELQLEAYTYNIKRYRGYPEVYNSNGDFYRQIFYKSVRQTGWVVSYEQAREMYTNRNQVN